MDIILTINTSIIYDNEYEYEYDNEYELIYI